VKKGTLKQSLIVAVAAIALIVPAGRLGAQQNPIAGGVVGDVVQWKGVVTSVNYQTRALVVKGPQGNLHAFAVNTAIPNLNTVKQGDTLTVDYIESIAVYVRKATDPPIAAAANVVTVKPTGRPAVSNVVVKEVQANVTAVNQATRTLTVTGPQGNSWTLQVDPSVTAFSSIKVGDQIVVRYTDAIAVAITK
jgi:hypothetical protein